MKILVLSHKPPYPIIDGGCLAMSKFLLDLSSFNEINHIEYFCINTHKHGLNTNYFPIIEKIHFSSVFVDTKIRLFSAFKAYFKSKSYNLSRFNSIAVQTHLIELCNKNEYDIIIFEGLFTTIYLDRLKKISKAKFGYRAHNIEHQIWEQLANNEKNFLKRFYMKSLAKNLKSEEIISLKSVDFILPLSKIDEGKMKGITNKPNFCIPVSIEKQAEKTDYSDTSLCFIGSFNWLPNSEAMKWFAKEIYPIIKKEFPSITLNIAGDENENIKELKNIAGIKFHGFVKNSSEFFLQNGIFIAPLQSGSGVKIKVLEALNHGMPCVLTEIASEGLFLPESQKICITKQDLIDDLIFLIQNENERKKRGVEGLKHVNKEFSSEKIREKLKSALFTLSYS